MPSLSIIGSSKLVVDTPGLTLHQLAGPEATNDGRISIAKGCAAKGTIEPFRTVYFDEWICVTKGKIVYESSTDNNAFVTAVEGDTVFIKSGTDDNDNDNNAFVTAVEGDTVFIKSGTRFRPSFLEDCEYIPVCLPGFRPELCVREDVENQGGQKNVENNDKKTGSSTVKDEKCEILYQGGQKIVENDMKNDDKKTGSSTVKYEKSEILYHMTTKSEWENAKIKNQAYFPKNFEADGNFTHATGVPSKLIETANRFYQGVEGDWICLQFRRSVLRKKFGIVVRDENPIYPHVYGGIPLDSVEKKYGIIREGTRFVSIEDLV